FTVSLSNPSTTAVSFNLTMADGTASGLGTDYGAGLEISTDGGATWASGTSATIAAGSTSVLVRTPITNDLLDEAAENFTLTATRSSGTTTNAVASGTATITDDDATPSLSINDETVNEAAGTATFTVTLSAASGQAVSVAYATGDSTATAGADYTGAGGTLSFAAGVTSQTVTVSILNDPIFENSEAFNVTLSAPVNATIADPTGVGTILDNGTGFGGSDNDTPAISVGNVAVTEGTDPFAVFTVSLNHPSTTAVNVNLALGNVSATGAGLDYGTGGVGNLEVSTDGGLTWGDATTATFAPLATSILVRTPVNDDALNEAAETFTLTATRTAGTTTNVSATGTATITDNDPQPTISIDDITVNEGTGTATFTVTLSAASGQAVSVAYATGNATATAGSDYNTTSGALNFLPGVTSQTITVPILNDAVFENSETFNVTLSGPTNATIADGLGVGTILDNGGGTGGTDNDTPTLAVSSATVTEGTDPDAVFTVSLSNLSTTDVAFNLSLADGLATGGDYGPGLEVSTDGGGTWSAAGSATIAAGATSVLVRTPITDDVLNEAIEDFTLTATVTSGTTTNASASGTGTIGDNDGQPTLSINDVSVNEETGTATFTVTLSAASGQVVDVNYATVDGTALDTLDYTGTSGMLSFAIGETSKTITVPILDDAIFENSEQFFVTLSGPVNALIADGTGIGTIRDDGTGSGGTDNDTPTLSVSDVTVTEGTDPFAVFTVSLGNASTAPVSVSLLLADGTALGGGSDFGTSGAGNLQVSTDGGTTWTDASTVTFAPGITNLLVRTPIANDALDEAVENFTVTAAVSSGITTNPSATGTATIVDNDPVPSLTVVVDDLTRNEAAGTMSFTVLLSVPSGRTVTVNYATSDGTANDGADYTGISGMVTFLAGQTSQTVTVPIVNDAIFENSETFNVVLSSPVNATIADPNGVGTILDNGGGAGGTDDDTPTLTLTNESVTEGADPYAVFTASLSNLSTTAVTFDLNLVNGTATAPDYGPGLEISTDGGLTWAGGTNATIAPMTGSVLVRTAITNDTLNENAETFTLAAAVTAGTTVNANAAGTGTINDNDAVPTLSIDDVTVNEAAGTATFTVTLSAASGLPVSVAYATGDLSATGGADYTALAGTLNFAAGATSRTITVAITNDTLFEVSENFNVTLSAPVNATIATAVGTGTILDDGTGAGGTDDDTPALAVSDVTVVEGPASFAVFTVSLSNASTTPVDVNLTLADGTATGVDYGAGLEVSTDGGLTWTPGTSATIAPLSTSVLVRTPITDDALNEAPENFTLTATRTAGTTTNASATGTAAITDDDAAPALSIDDVTVNEGAGTINFTVSLSAASGQPVSVNYATSNGSALAGVDYSAGTGTVNFAPGALTQTVTLAILNDAIFESSEGFTVTLAVPVNATIADGAGVGTILDDGTGPGGTDNDTPSLSVGNVTVIEGVDAYAVFEVNLSNPSAIPVGVNLALADGTATATDYGPGLEVSTDGGTTWVAGASATFAPMATSILVRTPLLDDAINEASEAFTLTATRSSGATANASASGTASITDDDGLPLLSIDDVTVNEGAGTITFTVSLTAMSAQTVTVDYAAANGTATGADYGAGSDPLSGTLSFAPGVTSQTVTLAITDDAIFEQSENFTVSLINPVNGAIADGLGIGTITDDGTGPGGADNDTPALSVSSPAVTEGTDPFAVFTVSLSNPSTTPVDVNLTLTDGSATGVDYGAGLEVSTDAGLTWTPGTSATIAPLATSVLVRTPITDDALNEAPENFTLTATRTAGTTTNASATGTATITDDDAAPALSIDDVTVNEGAGTSTFTVSLSSASGQPVSVNYATSNGSALAGVDYSAGTGTLNFAPGITSQTVTLAVLNDAIFESSEDFTVTLAAAVNATIADGVGVGTILDDGTGPGGTDDDTPSLSVGNVSVAEGVDAYTVFEINLSNPSASPVGVNLVLVNGTATGTDFGPGLEVSTDGGLTWVAGNSATFAPLSTSIRARTPLLDDAVNEPAEIFTLTATRASGTTSNLSASGTASITDDDGLPLLSINDVTRNEAAGTVTFTVSLNAVSGQVVTVDYVTVPGTATAGADYSAGPDSLSGSLTFAIGVTSQTITLSIADDTLFESSEQFVVNLSNATNAVIADAQGVATILDDGTGPGGTDDDRPAFSIDDVTVNEGAGTVTFTVTRTGDTALASTVDYATADGTAGAADYTGASGTLNFAAGVGAVTLTVPIGVTNDTLFELSEQFVVNLSNATNAVISDAQGVATILDDGTGPGGTDDDRP
ncbi:MAG: Calx-beta domain-containing protein, partial [Chthoniobacteraceae bacterium]